MNKPTQSLWLRSTLALALGVGLSGIQLKAQEPAPQPDQPAPSQQAPSEPTAQQPAPPAQTAPRQQAPDVQSQKADGQVFSGTVVKSSDKFMLQSADGITYDVDQQDLLKKYEGKQVRINGTLDPDGKTIHVK